MTSHAPDIKPRAVGVGVAHRTEGYTAGDALRDGTKGRWAMLTSREIHRGVRLSLQVLDREMACMVSHEEPYAVISITDPTFEHPTLLSTPTCRAVLRLRFSDVDERFARLNVTSHFLAAFCPTMAGEIAAFVEGQLALNTRLIVVHCEAGISRSAGVASALSRHYNGEESFFHGHYRPNRWVRQVLLNALQGSVPEEPPLKPT